MDCGGESAMPPLWLRAERCIPNPTTPVPPVAKAPPSLRLADATQNADPEDYFFVEAQEYPALTRTRSNHESLPPSSNAVLPFAR